MKLVGSAIVALAVLWLVDKTLSHGHYTDIVLAGARGMARSIGIR